VDRHQQLMASMREELGDVYPWEVPDLLQEDERAREILTTFFSSETATARQGRSRRRGGSSLHSSLHRRKLLMDTFGDSLRWVNLLYTKTFGKASRKAPAHMPHFVDVAIMRELHARWPERFEQTSAHKFRHPKDMQFAFSYMYYMMHAPETYSARDTFTELDGDQDGFLSHAETDYLTLILNSGKETFDADKLYDVLYNASVSFYEEEDAEEAAAALRNATAGDGGEFDGKVDPLIHTHKVVGEYMFQYPGKIDYSVFMSVDDLQVSTVCHFYVCVPSLTFMHACRSGSRKSWRRSTSTSTRRVTCTMWTST
jgi:hypothetical protein